MMILKINMMIIISPGDNSIISADNKKDQIRTQWDHHSWPVRVADQLHPGEDFDDGDQLHPGESHQNKNRKNFDDDALWCNCHSLPSFTLLTMMMLLHSTLCHLALILAHLVWLRYQGNWKSYCREEEENKYYARDGCDHGHNDSMIPRNGVHDNFAKVIATCICLSLSAYVTLALQVGFIVSFGCFW